MRALASITESVFKTAALGSPGGLQAEQEHAMPQLLLALSVCRPHRNGERPPDVSEGDGVGTGTGVGV